jgi:hypothetical protein
MVTLVPLFYKRSSLPGLSRSAERQHVPEASGALDEEEGPGAGLGLHRHGPENEPGVQGFRFSDKKSSKISQTIHSFIFVANAFISPFNAHKMHIM